MAHFVGSVAPDRLDVLLNDEVLNIAACDSYGRGRKILDHLAFPLRSSDDIEVEHYSLTITVALRNDCQNPGPSDRKELRFFVKTMLMKDVSADLPECSSTTRKVAFLSEPRADELFRDEVQYYSKIHPFLQLKYFGFPWAPRCQLSRARLIILQDATAMGYAACPVAGHVHASGNCFALEHSQVRAVLASLANLHAASMIAETHVGKPLNEVFPYAFKEKIFKPGGAIENGFRVIERLVAKYGLKSDLCSKIFERICELVMPKDGHYNVVNHGAPFGSNLLFDSRPWCLLVDYGCTRYAPACLDVALFIYMHTTPSYRAETESDLVSYYATCLQQTLQQSSTLQGVPIGPFPTSQNIMDKYRRYKIAGMARACYEWLISPLLYENTDDNFFGYLEACTLRLRGDSDAEDVAKDMLIELIQEAESMDYD